MSTPSALQLVQPVADQFKRIQEPVPGTAAVETIARVIAGRFRTSLGVWPFPFGTAQIKTIAFFVDAYVDQHGPEAIIFTNEVRQVLAKQFPKFPKPVPVPPPPPLYLAALERLTVGVLLTHSLPLPQAAPLAASGEMVRLYLEGLQAT
jgi:hypothetical protein